MRIALAHPTYWPEVTRGSERVIHDLGMSLAGRGHDVTVLTSHPGPRGETIEDGMRVVRRHRPRRAGVLRRYEDLLESAPGLARELCRDRFDLVHAVHPVDGWVASLYAGRRWSFPVIFSFHGMPNRQYLVSRRYRLEMLQATIRRVAVATVLSEGAAGAFRRHLLREPLVLNPGVIPGRFDVRASRAPEPTLLCASSLRDPRKRGPLLLKAFKAVRRQLPSARLLLASTRDPIMGTARMPSLPDGAQRVDVVDDDTLPAAYASAWATVLPAPDEAFGLVLVESLAAGTPVVAARSGAGPEVVNRDAIGQLFEPDDVSALAEAMLAALRLAGAPETAAACRERARAYDWSLLVKRYEDAYEAAIASSDSASGTVGR